MTRPIDSTIRSSNDIVLGACDVYVEVPIDDDEDVSINLGYTEGGVIFRYSYELYPVTIAKYGNRVIGHILVGESCSIKTNIISIKPVIKNKPSAQNGWWWWEDKDPKSKRFKTLELLYPTLSTPYYSDCTMNTSTQGDIMTTYKVTLEPLDKKISTYFTIVLPKATNIASLNMSFQKNKPIKLPVEFIALHKEKEPLFIIE